MKSIKFHLSVEHLWGLVVLTGIFVFINTHPIRPYDFWWHITIGREIISTGVIPATDIYSYTAAGQPYPSYAMFWLMEITLYMLYKWGGPALVIFVFSLLISSAYIVIFLIAKNVSRSWRIAAFAVLFSAALGLNDWNVRPQGITFLIASLFLLAIYQYQHNPRWYWLIVFPLGMLVWVNSHGTFIIGLALIGIWWAQALWEIFKDRFARIHTVEKSVIIAPSIALVTTALACLVNPRGLGIVNYVTTLTGNRAVQNLVTEWAPPSFGTLMGAIFLISLIISAIILGFSPKRPNFMQTASFIIFGLIGLQTSRGSIWFGLVMAPIIADHLAAIVNRFQARREMRTDRQVGSPTINILFASLIIIMGVISIPWLKNLIPLPMTKAGYYSEETPIAATQVLLEQMPPGRLFNSISFGSYLIWAAYPEYQVFVDSRIELFSTKVWQDYLAMSNAQGDWDAKLREYGVNTLMLSPTDQPAVLKAVQASGGWSLLYQDDTAYLFGRK